MRLTNKLLKEASTDKAEPVQAVERPKKSMKYPLILLLIFIIGGVVFAVAELAFKPNGDAATKAKNLFSSTNPALTTSTIAAPSPVVTSAAKTVTTAPVAQADSTLNALIRALNVSGNLQNTRLTILLNKAVQFSMAREPGQDDLTLSLNNVQMAEPLLPLNTQDTSIKTLTVTNVGNQLKVIMNLVPGTQVTQLNLNEQSAPELILDLDNQQPSSNSAVVNKIDAATVDSALLNNKVLTDAGLSQAVANTTSGGLATGSLVEKIPVPLSSDQQVEHKYQQALEALQSNKSAQAESLLKSILKQAPTHIMARQMLATILIQQNKLADAQQILKDGLKLQVNDPDLTQLLAQIYAAQGHYGAALSLLKNNNHVVLSEHPQYCAFEAALYQRLGQPLAAAEIYSQLVELHPNNAIWWMGLGTSLELAGKDTAALSAYRNALENGRLDMELKNYIKSRVSALGG